MLDLTPKQIVAELDRHIVGQDEAKRAVAIALRNRWRRQQLPEDLRKEVHPKNIIMIGPTGVGKTEIARRLAGLMKAPFCKVEATKYTEVGYHGRDVESVVRDLAEAAFRLLREAERERVRPDAEERANNRLLDLLLPKIENEEEQPEPEETTSPPSTAPAPSAASAAAANRRARDRLKQKLKAGQLEDRKVSLRVEQRQSPVQVFSNMGMENMDVDLQNMLERLMPRDAKTRELTVREARKTLTEEAAEALIDRDAVGERAVRLAEESGIIFIDEIDKVAGGGSGHGPDVSRQGVQRDLLPIVEGTAVTTRYGVVRTDHILFIAAGAFHSVKPSDLMPELQGRFPIRVELKALGRADMVRILREPKNSLIRQYIALLGAEGFDLSFSDDAVEAIAETADRVNRSTENIGARRLHTILEKLLEEPSFDACDADDKKLHVDAEYVRRKLEKISTDQDLSKFIL